MRQGSSPLKRPWSQSHRISQSGHELTHPIRVRQLAQVHVLDEALHEVDGDGGARSDACSIPSSVIKSHPQLYNPIEPSTYLKWCAYHTCSSYTNQQSDLDEELHDLRLKQWRSSLVSVVYHGWSISSAHLD